MDLSSPSRAGKTGLGEEDRLEARASLTDKITGSAETFADGRVSFSTAIGLVHPYIPSSKKPTLRALDNISASSRWGSSAVLLPYEVVMAVHLPHKPRLYPFRMLDPVPGLVCQEDGK